jgi:hypothetical protein
VRVSITSPRVRPSPNDRRVGIRIRTFEACSGFTFVTAHRIAQRPKAAFVAGLRPSQLPGRAACQLPDQSTIIRVRPSLTDSSRPRGARSLASVRPAADYFRSSPNCGHRALGPPLPKGANSGQQANRVFGWTSCLSGVSGGVECSCRRSGTCRNRRSGRTSSSDAIGRHTLLRDRPIFRFRSTIHYEVRAASAAARCVTSGEKR